MPSAQGQGRGLIVCVSVNDAFVMDAWGKDQKVGDKVSMVADGSADLTKALGLSSTSPPTAWACACAASRR